MAESCIVLSWKYCSWKFWAYITDNNFSKSCFIIFFYSRLDWKSMCIEIWIPKLLKELKKKKEEFASCSYISYFWCNILELILFCLLNFSSLGLFSVFCKFLFLHICLHYIPTCFYPPCPALPKDLYPP